MSEANTKEQQGAAEVLAINRRFIDLYYLLAAKRAVRTRKEYCESVGLSQTAFSQIEKGKAGCTLRVLCLLLKLYDVKPLWLFAGEGEPF